MIYDNSLSREEKIILRAVNNPKLTKEQRKVLKTLEEHERARGLDAHTIARKLESVEKLSLFLKKPFDKITPKDKIDYLSYLHKNYSGGTPNLHKGKFKWFYKWYYINFMGWKPRFDKDYPEIVEDVKFNKGNGKTKLPEELLTEEEIKLLVNNTPSLRNKALIMLLYDGALRISEALNLKLKHCVSDSYGMYIIVKGKTGMRKVRLVESVPYIKEYIDKEHPVKDDPNNHLFVCIGGRGVKKDEYCKPLDISGSGIRLLLMRIAERAGLKKKVNPHLFRHSKLTQMAKDFTESEMKIFAGWTGGSNMPQVYVHLSGQDVEKKILEKKGLIEDKDKTKKDLLNPIKCVDPSCNHLNPATNKFCVKCHRPLDVKTIMDIEKKRNFTDWIMNEVIDEEIKQAISKNMITKGLKFPF